MEREGKKQAFLGNNVGLGEKDTIKNMNFLGKMFKKNL